MTSVESLEQTVAKLPPEELAEFRRWFAQFDAAFWDARIEADAASGKFEALAAEALAEYNSGGTREV